MLLRLLCSIITSEKQSVSFHFRTIPLPNWSNFATFPDYLVSFEPKCRTEPNFCPPSTKTPPRSRNKGCSTLLSARSRVRTKSHLRRKPVFERFVASLISGSLRPPHNFRSKSIQINDGLLTHWSSHLFVSLAHALALMASFLSLLTSSGGLT